MRKLKPVIYQLKDLTNHQESTQITHPLFQPLQHQKTIFTFVYLHTPIHPHHEDFITQLLSICHLHVSLLQSYTDHAHTLTNMQDLHISQFH